MTDEIIQMITVWSAIGLVINVEADENKTYLFVFRGLRKMQNNPFTKGKKKTHTQYEGAFKTQEGKNLIFYREIDSLTSLIKTTAY